MIQPYYSFSLLVMEKHSLRSPSFGLSPTQILPTLLQSSEDLYYHPRSPWISRSACLAQKRDPDQRLRRSHGSFNHWFHLRSSSHGTNSGGLLLLSIQKVPVCTLVLGSSGDTEPYLSDTSPQFESFSRRFLID